MNFIVKLFFLGPLISFVQHSVKIKDRELLRAKELELFGFKSFDAMHLACSESGNADIFLTTDGKITKLAKRIKDQLHVNVQNPLFWLSEVL